MVPLTEIFVYLDDFCNLFNEIKPKNLITNDGKKQRNRERSMTISEMMTIVILFQMSDYKTFKNFYIGCICVYFRKDFPNLFSYSRFIQLMQELLFPLAVFLQGIKGEKTDIYYVDSTKLPVCDNLRINRNKVFEGLAKRGKTSTGWFFGFKLHTIINHKGEIMSFCITQGNENDLQPVENLSKNLKGWLLGDRGYISKKLSENLLEKGIKLITNIKKGMKKVFLTIFEKQLLKKRFVIETVFDQLKNIFTIDHSRHRSIANFQVNILAGLVAYSFKPKKPSVKFESLNNLSFNLQEFNHALIQNCRAKA
jgi:IS5 family transposase